MISQRSFSILEADRWGETSSSAGAISLLMCLSVSSKRIAGVKLDLLPPVLSADEAFSILEADRWGETGRHSRSRAGTDPFSILEADRWGETAIAKSPDLC